MHTESRPRAPHSRLAHRILTERVPTAPVSATVGEIEEQLHKNQYDTVNYIYLLDEKNTLHGVVSLKELYAARNDTRVSTIAVRSLVLAHAQTPQEEVARMALNHGLKAIPVVAKDGTLLGVVSSDAILHILNREHVEDALLAVGVAPSANPEKDLSDEGVWFHVRTRAPWLFVGLLGGMLAATVVRFFDGALEEQLAIAAFIPAVVYMADAVGSQTQMLFIRTLAVSRRFFLKDYFTREARVNACLALALSIGIIIISYFLIGDALLSAVLGIAILATITISVVVGLSLPLLLLRLKQDPAIATGPLATVIRDVLSLSVYLGIATLAFTLF